MESCIDKKCRVCLRFKDVYLRDITHHNSEDEKINFQIAFEVITSIYINDFEHDRFLCGDCLRRLTQAYEFRREALSSGQKLQQIGTVLMREPETEPDPEPNIKAEIESCSEGDDYDDNHFTDPDPDPWVKYETTIDVKDEPVVLNTEKKPIEKLFKIARPVKVKQPKKTKSTGRSSPTPYLNKAYCRFCLVHFPSKLGQHEKEHIRENGGMECHHCNKKFQKRKTLLEHIYRIHFMDKENRERFPCDLCDKTYTEKSAVRSHRKSAHFGIKKELPIFICTICGRPQKGKHAFENHINMVHKKRIVGYCNECGKGFKSKIALKNHLKFVHLKLREFKCPICLKNYIHALELRRHMTTVHTDEKPFHCTTCNKYFKTAPILKAHIRLHQSDFNYPCPICGMTFKTMSYVKGHMKAHSDQCDFKCKHCPKSFKRSGQLTKHMRLHTGNLMFCNLCSCEGFIDNWNLNEHIERVHVGVKYRCSTCGKEYGTRKHLRQHQNTQLHDRTKWVKIDPRKLGEDNKDFDR